MPPAPPAPPLTLFTTCPPSGSIAREEYVATVLRVGRWSEAAGAAGILVYTDNSLVDPWPVAQLLLQNTQQLTPLVAVQPVYQHPYWVAKTIATLGHLHGRRIALNMVAGGFQNDLQALGDQTPHDARYARLVEFTRVVTGVLASRAGFRFRGAHYQVDGLKMAPPLPEALQPWILMSGSSAAGLAAAKEVGAIAVQYPQPPERHKETIAVPGITYGIRIGVIARDDAAAAWRLAEQRFPLDRKGQLTHELAMRVSDSQWHQQLSELGKAAAQGRSPYWLHPFANYQTFCPYLVGDHATVARELAGYLRLGIHHYILDVPRDEDDLPETLRAFALARALPAT